MSPDALLHTYRVLGVKIIYLKKKGLFLLFVCFLNLLYRPKTCLWFQHLFNIKVKIGVESPKILIKGAVKVESLFTVCFKNLWSWLLTVFLFY